jgi:hypothetical protein
MKPRRPTRRHPQIHLPPLDAGYALTLVDIFERAIDAIWRAHGDRMAELLEHRAAARAAPRSEYIDDGNPDAPDDTPF